MVKMVYPSQQAPEYAFDCIPKVSGLQDTRGISAIGLYALVVALLLLGVWNIFRGVRSRSRSRGVNGAPATHVADTVSPHLRQGKAKFSIAMFVVSLLFVNQWEQEGIIDVADDDDDDGSRSNSLPPESVLHTLMWLVVCFAPVSGLVFKLGTLLAERLLYMPSISICMFIPALVSYILHKCMKRTWMLSLVLFWSCIAAIVSLYMNRTISYSQVWKTEENLFLESLDVCPNSAKLNLQVARIHLRDQQYLKAKQHLNKAKLIDPDYCDLHYFEAVVMISMNEDVKEAIDLLVRSLHCIYTSQSAIMLLYQLWDNQLQQVMSSKHRYYKLLEQQGLAAQKYDISFIAVKKFIDASTIAFEEKQYKDAINLSTKAEKVVLRSEAAQRNLSMSSNASSSLSDSVEGQLVSAEMRCRIFTLIGCYRYFLVSNNMHGGEGTSKKTLPNTSKSPQYQATLAKKQLTRAIELDCFEAILRSSDQMSPMVIEHIPIAIQHIVTMNSISFKSSDKTLNTSEVIERSIRLTNAFIVLNVMLHKVVAKMDGTSIIIPTNSQVALKKDGSSIRGPNNIDKHHPEGGLKTSTRQGVLHDNDHLPSDSSVHQMIMQSLKAIEMVASNEWTNCGLLFYRQKNYPKSLKCFTEKLKLLCNHSNNLRVSTVLNEFTQHESNYSDLLFKARTKAVIVPQFLDLQLTADTCSTLNW